MNHIFVYALHKNGVIDDSVGELLTAAKKIDPNAQPTAIVTGTAAELDEACGILSRIFSTTWKISHNECATCNAEAVRAALLRIVPAGSIALIAHEHFGMDLAPGLSIKLNAAYVPDAIAIEPGTPGHLNLVRQEFNGQFNTRVRCDISTGAVITIRPGAFKAEALKEENGEIVDKSAEVGAISLHRRYVGTTPAQQGDVDITKQTVLVSVGRGIQDAENISIAEKLAEALGGAVSCSRPVVDAKWLDKSRQVGSSGATVKPKVYLACGISGSFQHMAGIKGGPFLVAINKNPRAPIFQFADVGIVDDILEFLPALTERVREITSGKAVHANAVSSH